jgi:hypothetical protein
MGQGRGGEGGMKQKKVHGAPLKIAHAFAKGKKPVKSEDLRKCVRKWEEKIWEDVPALTKSLSGGGKNARLEACGGLMEAVNNMQGIEGAFPELVKGLNDRDPEIRYNCVSVLSEAAEFHHELKAVVPALIKALLDPYKYVRLKAAFALSGPAHRNQEHQTVIPALFKALSDPFENVRINAAWTLGHPKISPKTRAHILQMANELMHSEEFQGEMEKNSPIYVCTTSGMASLMRRMREMEEAA